MLSVFTSILPSRQWYCVVTRKARFRRFSAASQVCRWAKGISAPKPTITIATVRSPSLPHWIICRAKSSAHTAQKLTHRQWLEFLKQIDREIPLSQHIHIILDNYSTHKHPVVKRWLARHPRFELHFTPTGSSWMNLVERFFRDLSQQAILPGSFGSVRQLIDTIMQYLAQHNLNPKRYVWRAKGEEILAKIQRAWKAALGENKDVTII